jgi:hypothetical protein
LKQVRLRLGCERRAYTEVLQSDPEVKEGTEVVTNVIIEQATNADTGRANANNPLMGSTTRTAGGPGGGPGVGRRRPRRSVMPQSFRSATSSRPTTSAK